MQALRAEIEDLKAQELKLRQLIVEAAQHGAQETASQFSAEYTSNDDTSAHELQQDLEIMQGARQFAQGLVVSSPAHLAFRNVRAIGV